jgi:two-component system, sensor histidine kinase and response regulator
MNAAFKRECGSTKILVVDDRKENLFAMETLLRSLECEIFTAESGNEALSYTLRHDFALILLDVNMPEMDGFELAELLRSHDDTKQIPIIFVTAINKEDKSVFKGYESGAVDYLFKPVDSDILLSKVKVFLQLNRQKKQLEKIQAELERSNQSLNEFAQVVSHDMKNPLNAITGLCELVLRKHAEGLSDKGVESIKHIAGSANRMMHLITDVLAYAQVNAKQGGYSEVELQSVLDEVLKDLNNPLALTSAKIELTGQLPIVLADRTQMYQLLQNVISNGLKYRHPERTPFVRIFTELMEEGAACRIGISDNGIGMKQEDIPKIFDPFKRLDNAKSYEGTGLGLATVKKIVEQYGGRIDVVSLLGEGTTVYITLHIADTRS